MTDRRDFLKHGSLAAAAIWTGACGGSTSATVPRARAGAARSHDACQPDARIPARELMARALDAARDAGAGYADVRIGRYRQELRRHARAADRQRRRHRLDRRAACARSSTARGDSARRATLTTDGVVAAAREAVAIAKANRIARDRPVELAPHRRAPDVTLEERVRRSTRGRSRSSRRPTCCSRANAEAHEGAEREVRLQRHVLREGGAQLREHRRLGHRADDHSQLACRCRSPRSRPTSPTSRIAASVVQPAGRGYEYVLAQDLVGNAREVGRGGGAEAHAPSRSRSAATTSCSHPIAPLAHDPRVDRPPHGARSRAGLRGELRRHELHRAAREDARQAQVRPASS